MQGAMGKMSRRDFLDCCRKRAAWADANMTTKPYGLAVRALIRDARGRCLLLRRSQANRRFARLWEWPGGKCEPGEPFDTALRREVREETGLEIDLLGVVGASGFELPEVRVAVLCLEAKPIGGEVCLSLEHDEFAWVTLGEIANWKLTVGTGEMATACATAWSAKGV
jgi:8-oxo-dGTP diphosphatase